MIKIENTSILSLLPNFMKQDEEIKILMQVIQEELDKKNVKERNMFIYGNFENLNESILDELAYQWKVEGYQQTLTKVVKSNLVKTAYTVRRNKGTKYAVEKTVQDIHGDFEVQEWNEYNGSPYHFKIVGATSPSSDKLTEIYKVISQTKNERSYLEGIIVSNKWEKQEYQGIAIHQQIFETIEFSQTSKDIVEEYIRGDN